MKQLVLVVAFVFAFGVGSAYADRCSAAKELFERKDRESSDARGKAYNAQMRANDMQRDCDNRRAENPQVKCEDAVHRAMYDAGLLDNHADRLEREAAKVLGDAEVACSGL
jgi:hypothetical protein